ncbi:MAG: hypothetical protein LQ345_005562 [Seirophora villosa]|nr:MAG: hypothetical protein LQ345_005562 [Seirophora villosa]
MVYFNPGGYSITGPQNFDGWGISNVAFATVYTFFLCAACLFLWFQRQHPVVKMRKVGLMLLSVLVLHVFCFMVFAVYLMNGAFPCSVEFWAMSLYLPIGIGLWQAQNQQLLIVSRQQTELIHSNEIYKPLMPSRGRGPGTCRYWLWRFSVWYRGTSTQGKYEGFVFIGIIIQFTVTMVVYNISRKFNAYGIVSQPTSPGMCRRGWEWAPSVVWQFLWNFVFGPYLLWNIRMIRDIYNWRLQTIIAVVAGLPGTPIWLAALYTDKFQAVNKYWIPSMWFVPGMMAMEIVTVAFPIYQIAKHKRASRETNRILAAFDQKRLDSSADSSLASGSLKEKRNGKMSSMESLDACLAGNHHSLQIYASCMELNGENIIFLTRVLAFKQACQKLFRGACHTSAGFHRARNEMFRQALSIFVTLVHARTASYPINIESPIYNWLEALFAPATALIATVESNGRASSFSTTSSSVTPWDDAPEPGDQALPPVASPEEDFPSFPMRSLWKRSSNDSGAVTRSSERIVGVTEQEVESMDSAASKEHDPLEGVEVPTAFDETVFDGAYKSIRYMVWSETWQRYMVWKQKSSPERMSRAI